MKTLFVLRGYSGIINSLIIGRWEIKGIISMAKLIEKFSKDFENKFIFEVPDENYIKSFYFKKNYNNDLKSEFYLINRNYLHNLFKIKILSKIFHVIIKTFILLYLIKKFKIKNIYADNGNILYAYILKKLTNLRIILRFLTYYNIEYNLNKSWLINKIFSRIYKTQYDYIINTIDLGYNRDLYKNKVHKKTKLIELYNGCEFKIKNFKKFKFSKLKILFIGRLEKQKKCDLFINAARKLLRSKHANKFEFHIVGDGSKRNEYLRLIKNNGLSDKIIYHGKIERSKIKKFYYIADLIIIPGTDGFFNNVFIEAITLGVPVICQSNNYKEEEKIFKKIFLQNFIFKKLSEEKIFILLIEYLKNKERFLKTSIFLKNFSSINIKDWDKRLELDKKILNKY